MGRTRNSSQVGLKERQEEFWRHAIRRWQQSGQSQAEFCRVEKLSASSFSQWKVMLAKGDSDLAADKEGERTVPRQRIAPSFVRLELGDPQTEERNIAKDKKSHVNNGSAAQLIAAELMDSRNGYHVRIYNGADRMTLSALIAALATLG